MKAYSEINGWFTHEDVYRFLVSECSFCGTFVECGAWLGKSSAYLVDISEYKNLNVWIVDSWQGSPNELDTHHKLIKRADIYASFLSNMGNRNFKHLKALSCEASLHFDNESCDVVFIDMEHTYEAVKNDIELWLPKVKSGGYLAGHDYQTSWQGVMQAVDEKFGNNITVDNTCWIYRKE
jgi:hypothetical protein